MNRMELGEMGSGCEDEACDLASGFAEDCVNQECPVFGMIELACVTVVYIPLMLFGLFGNILTILVVWLRPQMRSSTYLYLSSMAVSDLLILLLLPLDLYKLWRPSPWPLGDVACKLSMFLSECCTFCTILHITFLSLERYLAVCWPITAKTLVTRGRTRVLIGCLWLGAAISAAPVLVMVGVEEVGGKEAVAGWREDWGLTSREGEQERVIVGEAKRGNAQVALMDAELGEIKWDETKGWSEMVGGFKEGEIQGRQRENRDEKQAGDYGDKEEEQMQVDGKTQNKMKEDEGGGREGDLYENDEVEIDRRECRCSDYAATSGLLSAMTILSNMYFLVPFCILGLVYSLIGRTLWLRPRSSRKDQSHRHTVKMLGVIVLAFVLCWLPYHVGRTIFSFSFTAYTQEAHADTSARVDASVYSDGTDRHAVISRTSSESRELGEKLTARTPAGDTCAKSKGANNNRDTSADEHFYLRVVSHTGGRHVRAGTKAPALDPATDPEPLGRFREDDGSNDTATDTGTNATRAASHVHDSHAHPDQNALFYYYLSQYFNLVSSVLFYLSAAVNPLLYNLMSARYRRAVRSLARARARSAAQSRRLRATITARHSTTTL